MGKGLITKSVPYFYIKEKVACLKLSLRAINVKDVVIYGCLENMERKIP